MARGNISSAARAANKRLSGAGVDLQDFQSSSFLGAAAERGSRRDHREDDGAAVRKDLGVSGLFGRIDLSRQALGPAAFVVHAKQTVNVGDDDPLWSPVTDTAGADFREGDRLASGYGDLFQHRSIDIR